MQVSDTNSHRFFFTFYGFDYFEGVYHTWIRKEYPPLENMMFFPEKGITIFCIRCQTYETGLYHDEGIITDNYLKLLPLEQWR